MFCSSCTSIIAGGAREKNGAFAVDLARIAAARSVRRVADETAESRSRAVDVLQIPEKSCFLSLFLDNNLFF